MSAPPVTLDAATIQAIGEHAARRTVELMRSDAQPSTGHGRMVSAAELADELGVTRQTVYSYADDLGAMRRGSGPRPRLRFDLEAARKAFACYTSKQSQGQDPSNRADPAPSSHRNRRRLPNGLPKPGSVLAVKPRPETS